MGNFEDFGPYEDALASLKKLPNTWDGFSYQTAIGQLEITPGLFFTPGNTWSIIIGRMKSWGWIEEKGDKLFLASSHG